MWTNSAALWTNYSSGFFYETCSQGVAEFYFIGGTAVVLLGILISVLIVREVLSRLIEPDRQD